VICKGCGTPFGAGHNLLCSGQWYTTTSNNTSGYHFQLQLNKEMRWSDELSKVFSQQEEPLADNIDRTLLAKLEGMRAARDEAVRYAQTLNDEAALHRIEDERLRAQATRIIDQVNEGTPVPEDS